MDKLTDRRVRPIRIDDLAIERADSGVVELKTTASTSPGYNRIFYGAPGTGKSYKVDKIIGSANIVRTVFHPDTQNSDFFGCLKPKMDGDKVRYGFAPGPFANALRAALLDPKHHHFLVIEELNRAPAAAVFGELFQLLDRNDDGSGSYEIDFPNPESKAWMEADDGPSTNRLSMPSNLSIIATMNSADQGVYPLDTAFRRRWEQEYLPLYEGAGPAGSLELVSTTGSTRTISWRSFIECLNDWLIEKLQIAEDRLLGQWFVRERELGGPVPAKILLYLWDDLLRHEGREAVFAASLKTYGQLDTAIELGKPIFAEPLLAKFLENAESAAPFTASGAGDVAEQS